MQYDAIFAAGLADFFLAEWGVKARDASCVYRLNVCVLHVNMGGVPWPVSTAKDLDSGGWAWSFGRNLVESKLDLRGAQVSTSLNV